MEIEAYLNKRFPGFKELDELEDEQRSLTEELSCLQESIYRTEKSLVEAQKNKFNELEHLLQRFAEQNNDYRGSSSLIQQLKQPEGDLNGLLRSVPLELGESLQTKLVNIKNIVELRDVVKNLGDLQELDTKSPGKSYASALSIEKKLYSYTDGSSSVVCSLAQKGIEVISESFRAPLQESVLAELRQFLKSSDWPKPLTKADEFSEIFTRCLRAEVPVYASTTTPTVPNSLSSFAVLAEAFDLRFQYFFESKQKFNQLDKPEWVFNYVVEFLDARLEFFKEQVQPLLLSTAEINGENRIALHEFITAILPSIYRKFSSSFPRLAESPAMLSHTVYELLNFDTLLKEQYYYLPFGYEDNWKGLTAYILSQNDWFAQWLNLEKESSMKRYNEIIEAPNAWDIEWDAVEPHHTKTTVSAIIVSDMLEGVTERYEKLGSMFYRLRFLGDIQVTILDKYYHRLRESVEAHESMNSSLARAVGGLSQENTKMVTGLNGLESLSKLYGSLAYTEKTLEKWGQDIFFVELWEAISRVNKKKLPKNDKVNLPDNEDDEGTLFDETIGFYAKLRERVMLNIDNLIRKELQRSMKEYFKLNDWCPDLPAVTSIETLTISGQLNQPIKVLTQFLHFLSRFHAPNDFLRFRKYVGENIKKYVFSYIVQANTFNQYGGQQLTKDVSELWSVLDLPLDASYIYLHDICLLLACDTAQGRRSVLEIKQDLKVSLSIDELRNIIRRRKDI